MSADSYLLLAWRPSRHFMFQRSVLLALDASLCTCFPVARRRGVAPYYWAILGLWTYLDYTKCGYSPMLLDWVASRPHSRSGPLLWQPSG